MLTHRAASRRAFCSARFIQENPMRSRLLAMMAATLFVTGFAAPVPVSAQTKPPALTGQVSSAEEGAMEGVVVSAKKGIVTVSVVSDDKGRFSFPASKLDAG